MERLLDFFYVYIMGSMEIVVGFYFYMKFFYKRVRRSCSILYALIGVVIVMVIPQGSIAEFFAYFLVLVAGGVLICKAGGMLAVIYAVITIEIMQLSFGIFNSLLCLLYPRIARGILGLFFMVLGNGGALCVSAICFHIVYKYFLLDGEIKSNYMLIMLTPTTMIFFSGEYFRSIIYGNTVTTDASGNIIDANIVNSNHFHLLLIQVLGLASLFCIMYAYKRLTENFHLQTELSLLEQEEQFLHQYVEEARMRYEKTKSFRHDIKNHMTVVKELLKKKETGQAFHYVEDMQSMTEDLSFCGSTNNPVVDILVGNKLGIARSNGIGVSCSLILPYPCSVRDIDLCIILSNGLDNAIQACQKIDSGTEKYIRVSSSTQGDFILLEIENSIRRKELFKRGTGLMNIKAVAEKYEGAISVKMGDASFILSVLLVISQQSPCIPHQIG